MRKALILGIAVLVLPVSAGAGTLFGIGDFGELYVIDTQTGHPTALGDLVPGNTTLRGMDYDWASGTLYATDNNGRVMTVDPSTATATPIGPPPGIVSISSLAAGVADQYIYVGQSAQTPSLLYRIDPATGAATTVGAIDFTGSGFGYTSGLAYDPISQTLFATSSTGASKLYILDPADAATQLVGDTGFGYVTGLTYAPDEGVLYGVTEPYGTSTLIRIDPQTGQGTAVGATGVGIFGLGYAAEIPEPVTMLTVVSALAGLGVFARRRRA
jgi:DNA-binding beta-propeller fold protein YncE